MYIITLLYEKDNNNNIPLTHCARYFSIYRSNCVSTSCSRRQLERRAHYTRVEVSRYKLPILSHTYTR